MTAPGAELGEVRRRLDVRVEGRVQGVGFRPHVFRLVQALGLSGFVRNDPGGVALEIEGARGALDAFLARLAREAPPLAAVEQVRSREIPALGDACFRIAESAHSGDAGTPVTQDLATCGDCLRELLDPADRRHRYPFICCTQCGPRFTVVRAVPYDRPLTTMASFPLCERCAQEYRDPLDRRFHAQATACAACGPRLRFADAGGREAQPERDPLQAVAAALRAGRIAALKGLGGFHLACRADDPGAVARLRLRKQRPHKPLALMVRDLESARRLVALDARAEALLCGPARPIVLAPRRARVPLASEVAPHAAELGVMLPCTPLQHLLLGDLGLPLVMTSGNRSGEPIAHRDADALQRLGGIADCFLLHDREIHARADDSVVRAAGPSSPALLLRRGRGHAPEALALPAASPLPLLACGADLKNAFCLAEGRRAWLSPHLGDLADWETALAFRESVEHLERLFAIRPRVLAHDLHPDYHTTRWAQQQAGVELLGVQHHHAHLCACLAEHGESGPAVGAIFDGTGYGTDGTLWGGELLIGGLAGFERAGHLRPVRMPGGERAIREPWRMACAWLADALETAPALPATLADDVAPQQWAAVLALAQSGSAAPWTSSVGRLFDAFSALCGLRATSDHEGQAALELEAAADPHERAAYPFGVERTADRPLRLQIDPRPALRAALRDLQRGAAPARISARFHAGLARATAEACARLAADRGLRTVVLAGGVFQNRRLLGAVLDPLARRSLRVLVPQRLPPGDGGIAYGQAAIAAHALAQRSPG